MKDVEFLYYQGYWRFPTLGTLVTILVSLALFGIVVLFMHNEGGARRIFQLGLIEHEMVRIRMLITKGLLGWSVMLLPLIGVYIAGAGEYLCGKVYLRSTAAYLRDHPSEEWAVAAAACVSFSLAALCIVRLRGYCQQHMIVMQASQPDPAWNCILRRF